MTAGPQDAPATDAKTRGRVLVVEDDAHIRDLVVLHLQLDFLVERGVFQISGDGRLPIGHLDDVIAKLCLDQAAHFARGEREGRGVEFRHHPAAREIIQVAALLRV